MNIRETMGANFMFNDVEPVARDSISGLPMLTIGGTNPFLTEQLDLEIIDELGAGGMGEVHVASQSLMRREVAIKRSHNPEGDGPSFESVINEGLRFGRFDHPNIPPVHMMGRDEQGRAVLVMKRISGDDWLSILNTPDHARWSDAGADRMRWNLGVLIQVCRAVEHAHSRRVIHRDIKTDNVMIGDHGQVYLIDWGVSVDLDKGLDRFTTQRFVGTPAFAAPEMIIEGEEMGPSTDVYLLGGALFEVMTGHPPHKGKTVPEILNGVLEHRPLLFTNSTPQRLQQICIRAMHPQVSERYASVTEFRLAIQQYLNERYFLAQLEEAQGLLIEMESLLDNRHLDFDSAARMMNISYRCRFALETVIANGIEVEIANRTLVQCLLVQTQYTVISGELRVAQILLGFLRQKVGVSDPRIASLAASIAESRATKRTQEQELSLQVHTRLLESLQATKTSDSEE